MNYSEMVMIPKMEYEKMCQGEHQEGGSGQTVHSFMNPELAYKEALAQDIIQTKPTPENVARYTMKLAIFDRIRRNFFKLPTPLKPKPEMKTIATAIPQIGLNQETLLIFCLLQEKMYIYTNSFPQHAKLTDVG